MMSFKKTKLSIMGLSAALSISIMGSSGVLANAGTRLPGSTPVSNTAKQYSKPNYTAQLDIYAVNPSIANPITMEKAAETGVKNITQICGADLNGKTVLMRYYAARDVRTVPIGERTVPIGESTTANQVPQIDYDKWYGEIDMGGGMLYWFFVKAETGEISSLDRVFSDPETGFTYTFKSPNRNEMIGMIGSSIDETHLLGKGENEYTKLAKEIVEDYQIMPGRIVSNQCSFLWKLNKTNIGKDGTYYPTDEWYDSYVVEVRVKTDKGQEMMLQFFSDTKEVLKVYFNPVVEMQGKLEMSRAK